MNDDDDDRYDDGDDDVKQCHLITKSTSQPTFWCFFFCSFRRVWPWFCCRAWKSLLSGELRFKILKPRCWVDHNDPDDFVDSTITRLVGNNRVYRWYGCWLVITYQERGLLNHTPTWHTGPPSVRWLRSYIWPSRMEGGRAVEQEIFILCTHTSCMAGGRWLGGGLYFLVCSLNCPANW